MVSSPRQADRPTRQKEHTVQKQTLPENIRTQLKEVQASSTASADLPQYIIALRSRGWTLDSIGDALELSRERVRQIAAKVDDEKVSDAVRDVGPLPSPTPRLKPVIEKKPRMEPLPENVERMLELQPLAQQVRGNGGKHRTEAEEYTRLINFEHAERGVPLTRLAAALGVTHGALRFRLVRYGYKNTESESRVYKKVLDNNRVV